MTSLQLCIIISLLLLFCAWGISRRHHQDFFSDAFIYNTDTDEDEDEIVPTNSFDPHLLTLGTEQSRRKRLMVVSLVRNCEKSIPCIIHKLKVLGRIFAQVKVYLFENNSTDNTRKHLLNINQKAGMNVEVLLVNPFTYKINETECSTTDDQLANDQRGGSLDGLGFTRINRMVILRNRTLRFIYEHQHKHDLLLLTDMDIIGRMFPKGIRETVGYLSAYNDIGFVSFRGYTRKGYFDPYSYTPVDTTSMVTSFLASRFVPCNQGMFNVGSAHSGGAFANLPLKDDLSYELVKSSLGVYLCEHVTLMHKVKNNCINTNMAFMVQNHV